MLNDAECREFALLFEHYDQSMRLCIAFIIELLELSIFAASW